MLRRPLARKERGVPDRESPGGATEALAAPPPRVGVELSDLSASARIREFALQLFARQGIRGTSIRNVAAAAGVSPGAVVHHFPTKRALEQAVHADVIQRIVAVVHGVGLDDDPVTAIQNRNRAFDTLLRDQPYIADYIRRVLADNSEESLDFFRVSIEGIKSELLGRVEAGQARTFDDPDVGLALYWLVVNARFILRPYLENVLHLDLQNPRDADRLARAETELLTKPVFPPNSP
jgi:AcrR family transcriptional regulator